jgi:drug/metabolite transporter (DMT)-like permease
MRIQSLWMLGASVMFSLMAASIKLAAGAGVPISHIIFYRGLFSVLSMSVYLKYRGHSLGTPHWRAHLRRALAGYVGLLSYVLAIVMLPLGTAVTLNYTSPLLLGVMLLLLHRERPEWPLLAALAGGLCGIVLLLRPTFEGSYWLGTLIALLSAVLAAWTALNIRALGRLKELPVKTVLYFSLFITVATLPWYLLSRPGTASLRGSAYVLAAATLAAIGQIMLTLAYQRGHTFLVSLLGYSQVVFTSVLGILVWNDRLTLMAWLGMALIIVSGFAATMSMRVPQTPDSKSAATVASSADTQRQPKRT